jgi:hypothetical protein
MAASVGELLIFRSRSSPNLSGYSGSRHQSVELVVAKGHVRWIRRLVAEILQLSPAMSTER